MQQSEVLILPNSSSPLFSHSCLRSPYQSKYIQVQSKRSFSKSEQKKICLLRQGSSDKLSHSSSKRRIKPLTFKLPRKKQSSESNLHNVSYNSTKPSLCSIKKYKTKIDGIKNASDQVPNLQYFQQDREKQVAHIHLTMNDKGKTQGNTKQTNLHSQMPNDYVQATFRQRNCISDQNCKRLQFSDINSTGDTFKNSLVVNNGVQGAYVNPSSYFASLKNSSRPEYSPYDSKYRTSQNSLKCSNYDNGDTKKGNSSSKISSGLTLNMARKVETFQTVKTENDLACYSFIEEEESAQFQKKLDLPTLKTSLQVQSHSARDIQH